MTPEQYLGKVLDMTEKAMQPRETTLADLQREHSREEAMRPEPKRIQCAHCNGYYNEDEICCKNLCYKCEEDLDDYHRIRTHRNMFLAAIDVIRATTDLVAIHYICDGILAQYKEEK